ncbi:MAG: hypothetical protein AAFZ15_04290 [Bacteroidota bacterium]
MKKLTTASNGLEAFTYYQIEKTEEIKGGKDVIIVDDTTVG